MEEAERAVRNECWPGQTGQLPDTLITLKIRIQSHGDGPDVY